MRAFRTERSVGVATALAAWVAGAPLAAAQLGPPVPLLPQATPKPDTAAPVAPIGAGPPPEVLEQQPLAGTDAAWTGTLSSDQGAFPPTLWQGTSRDFVAAALPLLTASSSPALQDLDRRLLLSNAASPAGTDMPDRPPLAVERLDRLLALGDVKGALGIVDLLPKDSSGDDMDRDHVQLQFAAGDRDGACATVNDRIARYQGPWWARALIACQALAGDGAKVSLGMSLLHEQKAPPDPAFDALISTLGGSPRRIDKLPDPSPLRLTLLAATKEALPAAALATAGPAALAAYANNGDVPILRRLPAAERAALLGALAPDALGELYRQVDVTPDEQTTALKEDALPQDAKSRAILFQVARSGAPAETREAAILALLTEARKRQAFPLTARLLVPALSDLSAEGISAPFAAEAARVLLVTGHTEAAQPWIAASGSKAIEVLRLLAAGPTAGDSGALVHDAVTELANRAPAAAPAQANLLMALLSALGIDRGKLDWGLLITPPHDASLPSAALWTEQKQAMSERRLGETVLASVLLVEAGERLSLEPMLLDRAIAGLVAVGCETDAHALALEAAIDAGI
ncbi:MAG TPA: hypothetical protein VL993_02870 [Stellaceae bacterium]|nr:hypothetical protein [Stellaceae bacterium]